VNRALVAGASLLVLLAACPLPQPLPDYPAGTVTPPRILMDPLMQPSSVTQVPASCTGAAPSYDLSAVLVDDNTSETVTARWFVDYDHANSERCTPARPEDVITGPGDQATNPTHRQVPAYHFAPYDHEAVLGGTDRAGPGVVHVVELVVSNRFDSSTDVQGLCTADVAADKFPYRMPASEGGTHFETQVYRWVFVQVSSATVLCPP
jgi:hypothetical protein